MSYLQRSLLKNAQGLKTVAESTDDPKLAESSHEDVDSDTHNPDVDKSIWEAYEQYKTQFESLRFKVDDKTEIQAYYLSPPSEKAVVFVCLHGAGSSSMTFASLTEEVRKESGVLLIDIRGHGHSSTTTDFSMDTLVSDMKVVIEQFKMKIKPTTPLYFIGHSLGGAVMANYLKQYPDTASGLIVLDIVEEIAVKSLGAMPQFIQHRPKSFAYITEALMWHMGFLLHKEESARLSVPDLFNRHSNGTLNWKLDLSATMPYWNTWFSGLSHNFLSLKQHKLLILSTHETLDQQLIVAQMQGKYQLVVFNNNPKCGHFVHEDLPRHTAISILEFVRRNEQPEESSAYKGYVPKWGGKINK